MHCPAERKISPPYDITRVPRRNKFAIISPKQGENFDVPFLQFSIVLPFCIQQLTQQLAISLSKLIVAFCPPVKSIVQPPTNRLRFLISQ